VADPLPKFRVGRKNGRNVYFQTGAEPSDSDQQVGNLDTPELAALFVVAVNADQDGFPPYCVFCMRPAIAHQGQLCSPEEPAPVTAEDLPGRQQLAATGSNDLRARLHDALTREHYRRARERIDASPEDHCAAFTDVVLAALAGDPGDLPARMAEAILQARFGDEMPSVSQLIDAARDAAAAMSVRWEHAAHLAARVGDAERRAEHAESEHQVTQDRLVESERIRVKLKQTIDAFPDAHQAANLADARAQRDALKAAIEDVETCWPDPFGNWSAEEAHAARAVKEHMLRRLLAALAGEDVTKATEDRWACPRCGSARWVAASLTGPVEYGGRAIKQCIPCGHYSNDPVKAETAPDGGQ
jgi:rubrerythrin